MQKHINFFKKITFYTLFVIIVCIFPYFFGCSYGNLVSISEQIAIYQNMGFYKADCLKEIVSVDDIQININTLQNINDYLSDKNINSKVQDMVVLVKVKDKVLEGLLYIYFFENSQLSKAFFSHFSKDSKETFYLASNIVVQKGVSSLIGNQSLNHHYYINFCSGLKK